LADPRRGQEGSVSKSSLAKTVPPFTQTLYKVIGERVIGVLGCDNKSAACETDVVVEQWWRRLTLVPVYPSAVTQSHRPV
jgi:hypothetical protein